MPYYIKRKAKKKDKPLPLFDKAGGGNNKEEAGFGSQTRQSLQPLYPAS